MNNKIKIILSILVILVLLGLVGTYIYLNQYYPSEVDIAEYDNTSVQLVNTTNGLMVDGPGNEEAIIFYPGAQVEYTAYIPLLYQLAENNIDCFIIRMPYNLAILDKEAADNILTNGSYNYNHWYIAGHSMGGAMGAQYTKSHESNITGLILLASYSTDKLKTPTLSVYGSNDKVLNMENYQKNRINIENLSEYKINGANHAQYAYYGKQDKDGDATITREEQINNTTEKIIEFIKQTV